jgi:hypothetical protein
VAGKLKRNPVVRDGIKAAIRIRNSMVSEGVLTWQKEVVKTLRKLKSVNWERHGVRRYYVAERSCTAVAIGESGEPWCQKMS